MDLIVFLLDISGSMEGSRIDKVTSNLNGILENLSKSDEFNEQILIGVYTFNDKIQNIIKIGTYKDHEELKIIVNGTTDFRSAYKGLINELENVLDNHNIIRRIVFVLTDGQVGNHRIVKQNVFDAWNKNRIITQFIAIETSIDGLKDISLNGYPPVGIEEFQIQNIIADIFDFINPNNKRSGFDDYQKGSDQSKNKKKYNSDNLGSKYLKFVPIFLVLIIFAILLLFTKENNTNNNERKEALKEELSYTNVIGLEDIKKDSLKSFKTSKRYFLELDKPITMDHILKSYGLKNKYEEIVVFNLFSQYNSKLLLRNGYEFGKYNRKDILTTGYLKIPNLGALMIERSNYKIIENEKIKILDLSIKQKEKEIRLVKIERIIK